MEDIRETSYFYTVEDGVVYSGGVGDGGKVIKTICTCTKCGHNFSVKEHCGKIESINDEGPSQKVPTIDTPITVPDGTEIEDCTISLDECNAKGIEIKYHQELFDDLCKEVENVKKQLEQLNIDIKDIKRKNILF